MSTSPRPQVFVHKATVIHAMQWSPDDPATTGAIVGWLMGSGVGFHHPSGSGPTTTIQLDGEPQSTEPGGWIVQRASGQFGAVTSEDFETYYVNPEQLGKARVTQVRS